MFEFLVEPVLQIINVIPCLGHERSEQ
jgi:hypothetical protein